MADTHTRENEFRSTIAGITVEGRAHPLSTWFVLALRLVIGFAFLYSGFGKALGDFDAQGYLTNVAARSAHVLYVSPSATDTSVTGSLGETLRPDRTT